MKIKELMPHIYNNNLEMNAILDAENFELEDILKLQIKGQFNNTFIIKSDIEGIRKFEDLFDIKANEELEDLEFRRQRLLNRMQTKSPFTERYLQIKLDEILGKGRWSYDIVYNDYTLDIYSLTPGKLWLNELKNLLEKIIPCNIVWTIHIYSIIWNVVKENTQTWNDLIDMDLTWEQVMEGEWVRYE